MSVKPIVPVCEGQRWDAKSSQTWGIRKCMFGNKGHDSWWCLQREGIRVKGERKYEGHSEYQIMATS
jgi:hypothetical protein